MIRGGCSPISRSLWVIGELPSDLAALRGQAALLGDVAAHRVMLSIGDRELPVIRAWAAARARAWEAGAVPARVVPEFAATRSPRILPSNWRPAITRAPSDFAPCS
jgi:hypothetical protein